jgi:conjugative relaxase-like TrwC/TraI family protein
MMTCATVSKGDNTLKYFLATEYYTGRSGEPKDSSQWNGKGAQALGLTGAITKESFAKLLEGFGPNRQKLTANAGRDTRKKQGIDATVSVPKGVSILAAHASPEMREKIIALIERSNSKAMDYIESNLNIATGKGGQSLEKAHGVAVASFTHFASRNLDPQFHIHNVIFAAAQREDGTWGGLDEVEVRRHQKAGGALFRSELAQGLCELGFTVKPDLKNGFGFTIEGIDDKAQDHYSTRREEVLKYLKKHGLSPSDAAACQRAQERTKTAKHEPEFKDMLKVWEIRGKPLGLSPEYIDSLARHSQRANVAEQLKADEILAKITQTQSAFERKDVLAAVADEASKIGGMSAAECEAYTDKILKKNAYSLGEHIRKADRLDDPEAQREALYIGTETPTARIGSHTIQKATRHLYTTPDTLLREIALYTDFKTAADDHRHDRTSEQVKAAREAYEAEMSAKLGKPVKMKDEQIACLEHVATAGRQALIVGFSGTGKSFTMGSVRAMEEAAGQHVIATALAGKAASGLKQGASIETKESGTLASLLLSLEKGQRREKGGLIANEKTTIILDEAGMVGASQYRRLQELAPSSKIIILGDDKQYQAIDSGNFFGGLQDKAFNFKKATLKSIERQKLPWHLEAVLDLKEGRGAKALEAFNKHGLLKFKSDTDSALKAMALDYVDATHNYGDLKGQKVAKDDKVAMASTHAQSRVMNEEVRRLLIERGELGSEAYTCEFTKKTQGLPDLSFEREIRQGDRLRITHNDKKIGINNGELCEIQGIKRMRAGDLELTLKVDGHKQPIKIRTSEYNSFEHGYCATGHASQGVSVSRAFTYLDESMIDKNAGYVLGSRSKYETTLYASSESAESVEQAFSKLARSMSRNGESDWSLDYLGEKQREELAECLKGTPEEQAQKVKEIEAKYGAKLEVEAAKSEVREQQAEAAIKPQNANGARVAKEGQKPSEHGQEQPEERVFSAKNLAKGATLAISGIVAMKGGKVLVKEAKTGRLVSFEGGDTLSAKTLDKGASKSFAEVLKANALEAVITIGEGGKADAIKAQGLNYKATQSGQLGRVFLGTVQPVKSFEMKAKTQAKGFSL